MPDSVDTHLAEFVDDYRQGYICYWSPLPYLEYKCVKVIIIIIDFILRG